MRRLPKNTKKMCYYATKIKNKRYIPTKKNGGWPETCTDERKEYIETKCGRCRECMKQRQRNWQIRLAEEIKKDKTGQFATLTFSDQELEKLSKETEKNEVNELATIAVRRFNERWRKKYKKALKHFLVTELGQDKTERIHLHGLIFTTENKKTIEQIWKYGWYDDGSKGKHNEEISTKNKKGYVSMRSINYITKYITKPDAKHPDYKAIILTSPGIGRGFIKSEDIKNNKFKEEKTNKTYRLPTGQKVAMPRYYLEKIYTQEERDKLWEISLDENIKYINGNKIDLKTYEGLREIKTTINHYRKENIKLGYKDGTKWKEKKYKILECVINDTKVE